MSINFNEINSGDSRKVTKEFLERENDTRRATQDSEYLFEQFCVLDSETTYLDLIKEVALKHSQVYAGFLKAIGSYDFENFGLPQFYLIVIVNTILADGFLSSITDAHILDSHVSEADLTVSCDNFYRAQSNLYKFITGQFQKEDYDKISELLRDPVFYSFLSIFTDPIASQLESSVREKLGLCNTLTSEHAKSGDQFNCEVVRRWKLPLLTLQHNLSCATGFEQSLVYPNVCIHFKYLTTGFAMSVASFATIFNQILLRSFIADEQMLSSFDAESDKFRTSIRDLNLYYLPKSVIAKSQKGKIVLFGDSMQKYTEKLRTEERLELVRQYKEAERQQRNQQRAADKAAREEALALKKAQDKEKARLESIQRQEELAEQARLAEIQKKALLEQVAIKEKEKALQAAEQAEELYLFQLHIVVEQKQELIDQLNYIINQLNAMKFDSSIEVLAFKQDLCVKLNNLKLAYSALDNISAVEITSEVEVDSSKEDYLGYIEMLDADFKLIG